MSEPEQNLESLVASSSTFQDWVGAASEAAAKDSVHIEWAEGLEAGDPPARPHAVIWMIESNAGGPLGRFLRGTLGIRFEAAIALGNDGEASAIAFRNKVYAIKREMESNSRQGGRLIVRGFQLGKIVRNDFTEIDQTLVVEGVIDFGPDGF
jgi:hypothetical protein